MIQAKRVYDEPSKEDGYRILVDRLWPRGLTKEKAHVDLWMKEIAPSDELRKWFHHEDQNWTEFVTKYKAELARKKDLLNELKKLAKGRGAITLLFGSKDEKENQAVVLAQMLQDEKMSSEKALHIIAEELSACRKCPRLVKYRETVARAKRRAFRDWEYWGRGVPGFGDAHAQLQLFIIGLAPAAHGGNRTGRTFTGDRSGDFLYQALYEAGFANQPTSVRRDDGLKLRNAYVAAAARCAPPLNKPLPNEIVNCRGYLERELALLQPKAILALGKTAWDAYLDILKDQGKIVSRAAYKFSHGAELEIAADLPRLFGVYHPSQQNTQTGRLTLAMYEKVLKHIRSYLNDRPAL
jgi:uracil-DNA glycosylase family 4